MIPPGERKGLRINVARWAAAVTLAVVLAGAGYEGWLVDAAVQSATEDKVDVVCSSISR